MTDALARQTVITPPHSKLIRMKITNLGCIGPEGLTVELDKVLCLVGPNNTGKSTVLRAYELAVGNQSIREQDFCQRADGKPASVEIWVHVPTGTANIDEKWKEPEGPLLLVQSRWEWSNPGPPKRTTWDPETKQYASDGKAAGLDTVFSKRLPQPFRIEALENPEEEHRTLLKLIVEPISDELTEMLKDEQGELSQALIQAKRIAEKPVQAARKQLESIQEEVNQSYKQVFKDLSVHLNIQLSDILLNPTDALMKGSQFQVKEWGEPAHWAVQGTGSQRALFWSMLQVRSKLKEATEKESKRQKRALEIPKAIEKKEQEITGLQKDDAKQRRRDEIASLKEELAKLEAGNDDPTQDPGDPSLPGYMLLIDEPETCLHPSSVRAARNHLYGLGKDPRWQVMISTHSPLCVDPLEDHTTIVRLERTGENPSPKTYRSDEISFSENEKENLKMLLRFDQALAEMFFGPYPILVEGDTEFVALETIMRMYGAEYPENARPIIVRARGKSVLILLIKMLSHFYVPFSVLHDTDAPRTTNGAKKNPAWTLNKNIYDAVETARKRGLRVVHRVSLPDFERSHGLPEIAGDKPWEIWEAIKSKPAVQASIKGLFDELLSDKISEEPFEKSFNEGLSEAIEQWAKENEPENPAFKMDN